MSPPGAAVTTEVTPEPTPDAPSPSETVWLEERAYQRLQQELLDALPDIDFVSPLVLDGAGDTVAADARNAAGLQDYGAARYDEAIAELTAALAADPGHLPARYNLARAYAASGQMDRGLALLAEVAADPRCERCADAIAGARVDDEWSSQWSEPVFAAIMRRVVTTAGELWEDGCPDGARLRKNPASNAEPGTFAGTAWCEKGRKKHGPYYQWLDQGCGSDGENSCFEQGVYVSGLRQGFWIENRDVDEAGYYVDGKRHGFWTSTGGTFLYTDLVYRDGVLQGPTRGLGFDYENLLMSATYVDGVLHGSYKQWDDYEHYVLVVEGTYDMGAKHGVWSRYRRSAGTLLSRASYDHDVRHGTFTYWDAAGDVLATTEMSHGDGAWVSYDEQGTLLERGAIVDGKKDGEWFENDTAAERTASGSYREGIREGAWTIVELASGRQVEKQGSYAGGKRDGAWTYRMDGEITATGSFAGGEPDGVWTVRGWNADGDTIDLTYEFRRGALVRANGKKADRRTRKAWQYWRETWVDEPREISPPAGMDGEPLF